MLANENPNETGPEGVTVAAEAAVSTTDAWIAEQWYVYGESLSQPGQPAVHINIAEAWEKYDGSGVKVAIADTGFDIDHPELQGKFDLSISFDPRDAEGELDIRPDSTSESHGTRVAGIIGADKDNGVGMAGLADGATLAGLYLRQGWAGATHAERIETFSLYKNYDVVNNSWGFAYDFYDNFSDPIFDTLRVAIESAFTEGRGGLGTNVVFGAGNAREMTPYEAGPGGSNTNYHSLTNLRQIITVGGTEEDGGITGFSTPGSSILVSAPAQYVLTTKLDDGDGNRLDDFTWTAGTSFAAPIVSGVIALMLEANPDLGYRDVQEILALSAQRIDTANWSENGATTWNGGGLLFNEDHGFGIVDASVAVRLAEAWVKQQTAANEAVIAVDGQGDAERDLGFATDNVFEFTVSGTDEDFALQWVEVDVSFQHGHAGDLVVELVSGSGTVSVLMNRPAGGTDNTADLSFTLTSNNFWGEDIDGTWQLVVRDEGDGGSGSLADFDVRFYGTSGGGDDYVFTDQFADLGSDPLDLVDEGGSDTLMLAALSGDVSIDLNHGAENLLAGRILRIGESSDIENAITGNGDDTLTGNALANELRGNAGNDTLRGGQGSDLLYGGEGEDTFLFADGDLNDGDVDTIGDLFQGGPQADRLVIEGILSDDISASRTGNDIHLMLDLVSGSATIDLVDFIGDVVAIELSGGTVTAPAGFAESGTPVGATVQFDLSGSGSWSRMIEEHDAYDAVVRQIIEMHDGSSRVTQFDVAGDADYSSMVEHYDGLGRLSLEEAFLDDGTSWSMDWDEDNTSDNAWLRNSFSAQGELTFQVGYNDDGTSWAVDWDTEAADTQSWYRNDHDLNGELSYQVGVYDDGAWWAVDWDSANESDVSWWRNDHDLNGDLSYQVGVYDDGAWWAVDWDSAGESDVSWYRNDHDVNGNLTYQVGVNDDGSWWAVDWDTADEGAISWYRNDHDVNGDLSFQVGVNDDGSWWVMDWDTADETGNRSYHNEHDTLGRLDVQTIVFDDGTVQVTDFDQAEEQSWDQHVQLFDTQGGLIDDYFL